MDYFVYSANHLIAELEQVDLLFHSQIARVRQRHVDNQQFHGPDFFNLEMNLLLKKPAASPLWHKSDELQLQSMPAPNQLNHLFDLDFFIKANMNEVMSDGD